MRFALLFAITVGMELSQAAATEQTSIRLEAKPLAVTAGILGQLTGKNITLGDTLLAENTAIALYLNQAQPQHIHQALGHAANAWWYRNASGKIFLSKSALIPPRGPLRVQSYSSRLQERHDIEQFINDLMEPWLRADGTGIAYVPWTGQWTATFDGDGHAQLRSILRLIETGSAQIPSYVLESDKPANATGSHQLYGTGWLEVIANLATDTGWTISPSPDLVAAPGNEQIRSTINASLPGTSLALHGLQARWVQGVLCMSRSPIIDRQHPAQTRRLAQIPLPEITNATTGLIVAERLRSAVTAIVTTPGWGLAWLTEEKNLLIAANEASIHAVMQALDRLSEAGVLQQ